MRRLLSINPWLYLLFFVLLLGAVLGQQYRLFERAWFSVQEWQHGAQWRDQSLWLGDYRVVIEAKPIADISDVSALTTIPIAAACSVSPTSRPR